MASSIENYSPAVTVEVQLDGRHCKLVFDGNNYSGDFLISQPHWNGDDPVYVYASSYPQIAAELRALADTLDELYSNPAIVKE